MDLSDSLRGKKCKQRLHKQAGFTGGKFISRDQDKARERLPMGRRVKFAKAPIRVLKHILKKLASKSGF